MPKFVLKDAQLVVNSVNLSDHASSVSIEISTDEVDVTTFSAASYREFLDGFKDATITATFLQDFAAASVDATLWPLASGTATFPVTVKATSAATSATNPIYTLATARMFGYTPIGGGVGDASTTDTSFRNAGTAGLTRGTV